MRERFALDCQHRQQPFLRHPKKSKSDKGTPVKATRKVNYARVDAKELPDLLRAIEVYQGTHVTRFALKLMAYLEPRARMMQDWAEFLEQTRRGGKVLPFRGSAA